jgi:hypothetical protein
MAFTIVDAIKAISERSVNMSQSPFPASANLEERPWQGTDMRVFPDSNVKYMYMDISYWDTDMFTGAQDVVGE